MTFEMKAYARIPDGSVMLLGIRYPSMGDGTKVFEYALIKAAGLWYTSGTGRTPQAAGWGAVDRWLAEHNRVVVSAKLVTETAEVYSAPAPEPRPYSPEDRLERESLEPGMFYGRD